MENVESFVISIGSVSADTKMAEIWISRLANASMEVRD
jgi:hypothetical protein